MKTCFWCRDQAEIVKTFLDEDICENCYELRNLVIPKERAN